MRWTSINAFLRRQLLSPWFVLYLTLCYVLCVIPFRPEIVSSRNLSAVAISGLPLIALAVGQSFVVVTGGIDLSLTSLVALASVFGASAMTQGELAWWGGNHVGLGVLLVMSTACLIGLLHGIAVAWAKMPAFLVTLVSMMVLQGLAAVVTRSQPIGQLPNSFLGLAARSWFGLPLAVWLMIALLLLAGFVLHRSLFGRCLFAVGQNAETARVSGVPVRKTLVGAYLASGFCAGIATLLFMANLEAGKPDLIGDDWLLDCLAAVVIGGTSLMGGRSSIVGTTLGALFMTFVGNSLTLFGTLQFWHVLVVKGTLILLAAMLETLRVRISEEGSGE